MHFLIIPYLLLPLLPKLRFVKPRVTQQSTWKAYFFLVSSLDNSAVSKKNKKVFPSVGNYSVTPHINSEKGQVAVGSLQTAVLQIVFYNSHITVFPHETAVT